VEGAEGVLEARAADNDRVQGVLEARAADNDRVRGPNVVEPAHLLIARRVNIIYTFFIRK
ncbi:uncharacterized protein METZ01_LOCUS441496, partial [marine metagenome]